MKLISFEKQENKGEAIISVDRKIFEKELNVTYNYQKKWFSIPGFRKGKVPRSIIENSYGHDIFYDGALQNLYVELLNFVKEEKNEKIISLKNGLFTRVPDDGAPTVLKSDEHNVEVKIPLYFYPTVSIDFKDMTIEVEKEKKASKNDIDAQKQKVFDKNATFEVVNDGSYKVSLGDMVTVSLDSIKFIDKDGNDIDDDDDGDDQLEHITLTIGSGRAWKEFEDALIGHCKNEGKFSATLTFPEDKRLNVFSKKTVRFELSVTEIKHLTPPSTEKLLEILKLKSEDELNSIVEKELNDAYHSKFNRDKELQIESKLLEQVPDDMVCEPLVNARVDDALKQLQNNLASNNLTLDYYCRAMSITPEIVKGNFSSSIRNDFKLSSALINISEVLKMSCSDKEVSDYFENLSKSNRVSVELAKKNISLSQVCSSILCGKVMDYMLNNVTVKEKKEVKEEKKLVEKETKKDSSSKKTSKAKKPVKASPGNSK